MSFSPQDIAPEGYVPDSTALAYTVARDGEIIGRVHAPQAPGWLNAGKDPREEIARQLNATEESVGYEKLANALRDTLDPSAAGEPRSTTNSARSRWTATAGARHVRRGRHRSHRRPRLRLGTPGLR